MQFETWGGNKGCLYNLAAQYKKKQMVCWAAHIGTYQIPDF